MWSVPLSITIYAMYRLFRVILRKSKLNCKVLSIGLNFRSKLWVLVIMVLEPGILTLTFHSANQIRNCASFQFVDKLNIILSVLVLFVFLIYCSVFYILIRKYYNKSAEILLAYGKSGKKGFCVDTFAVPVYKIMRGFVHSALIVSHPVKLFILIGLDLLHLGFILKIRKFFLNKVLVVRSMAYSLTFIALNALLL